MKKIILIASFALAVLAISSCGNKKAKTDDSAAVSSNATTAAEAPVSTETAPDAKLFDLKGNVSAVAISIDGDANVYPATELCLNASTVDFDDNGVLNNAKFNGDNNTVFEGTTVKGGFVNRDKQHKIMAFGSGQDERSSEYSKTILYGPNGEVIGVNTKGPESDMTEKFTTDGKGQVVSSTVTGSVDVVAYTVDNTFAYADIDEQGNWTKATVTATIATKENNGPEVNKETKAYTITRKITYK